MTEDERVAGETPTPEMLESVWKEFSGELRQFIGRRVSRPQDADDILQLVALRMVQSSDELRDRQSLLGWLFVEQKRDGHPTTLGAASGAVAGLVATGIAGPTVAPLLTWEVVLAGLGLAILLPVIPFTLELVALRRLTAGAFGTLMALEPAFAMVIGLVVLGQVPGLLPLAGCPGALGDHGPAGQRARQLDIDRGRPALDQIRVQCHRRRQWVVQVPPHLQETFTDAVGYDMPRERYTFMRQFALKVAGADAGGAGGSEAGDGIGG